MSKHSGSTDSQGGHHHLEAECNHFRKSKPTSFVNDAHAVTEPRCLTWATIIYQCPWMFLRLFD